MDIDVFLSASVVGTVFTIISNILIVWYKSKKQQNTIDNVTMRRLGLDTQKTLTDQFEALIRANELYRDEVRSDMERMREQYDKLHSQYLYEMDTMKQQYEAEITTLRAKIAELTIEVTEYRRENGALHLLLQQQGIEIPSWINTKEKEK